MSQLLDPFSYKKQKVDLSFLSVFFIEEIDRIWDTGDGQWGLSVNLQPAGKLFHLSPG